MCVIAYVPSTNDRGFDPKHIPAVMSHNSEGFGMMYPSNGKIKIIKGVFSADEIEYMIGDGPKNTVAYHFRYATHGNVCEDLCHPFVISDDCAFMHNGTFYEYIEYSDDKESDTSNFAKHMKEIHQRRGNSMFFTKEFTNLDIGHNKLLFMGYHNSRLYVNFINPKAWDNFDGMRVSNTYSFRESFTAKYSSKNAKNKSLDDWWDSYQSRRFGHNALMDEYESRSKTLGTHRYKNTY